MRDGTVESGVMTDDLEKKKIGRWAISMSALRAYTMVFALIVIWIFFQVKTVSEIYPYGLFLHPLNFANLLKQMAVTGVLAVGMLMVIVARQIDLSVGSIVGLAGGVVSISTAKGQETLFTPSSRRAVK